MTLQSLILGVLLAGSPQSADIGANTRDPGQQTREAIPAARTRDGTADIARVAAFLVNPPASPSKSDSARDIEVLEGRASPAPSTIEQFQSFIQDCEIKEIMVMTGRSASDNAPVMARWVCPVPQPDKTASFWVDEVGITRLSYGVPERVSLGYIESPGSP